MANRIITVGFCVFISKVRPNGVEYCNRDKLLSTVVEEDIYLLLI